MALDPYLLAKILHTFPRRQVMWGVVANRHNDRAGAKEVVADPRIAAGRADIDSLRIAGLESHDAGIGAGRLAADQASAYQYDHTHRRNSHGVRGSTTGVVCASHISKE